MASMKSWSALERRLLATAIDWRCASAAKPRARTSGTQIWIGRRPCLRSRKRWARTQLRQVRQPTLAPDEQTAQLLLQLLHRTRQRGRTHPAPLGCPREVPPKNSGSDTAPRDPPILTDLPVRCPRPPQRSYSLAYRHRSYAHSGLNQIGPNSTNLEQLRAWSRRLLSNPTRKSDAIDRRGYPPCPALIWRRSASPRPAGLVPPPCAAPELFVCTRAAVMPTCITTKIVRHGAFRRWYKQLAIK